MSQKNFICISCPIGCNITYEKVEEKDIINGARCPRGIKFVKQELTQPLRGLCSTVKTINGKLLPVKITNKIPIIKFRDVMEIINNIVVTLPIKVGDVICSNLLNLNTDLVATKSMEV